MDENLNMSQPRGDMFTNVSRVSAHGDANFPFVEGNPFSATLWVGLEGFHMTVNGRHETSFAYREVRYELMDHSRLLVLKDHSILAKECSHSTSLFSHLQKLEPWSVTEVKVAGGLDVLSGLAKGLPVSEDHDLVVDVEHLKAPPLLKKRLVMLVGVFSTGNNFERRMALRRAWMQYEAVRSGDVAVRFFIGLVSEPFEARNLLFTYTNIV